MHSPPFGRRGALIRGWEFRLLLLLSLRIRLLSFGLVLSLGLILLVHCVGIGSARAENYATGRNAINYRTSGIRFKIKSSIKASPALPGNRPVYDRGIASLTVRIRISSHARESQFYGVISKNFSNFRVDKGSDSKLIWQDSRCHQRRGLPKTEVFEIDGAITTARAQISVHARPRRLGLLLPSDEITQEIKLPEDNTPHGPLIAYRSETKLSHLLVDVKIYAFDCDLAPPTSVP